ncbi:MAG: GTPase Era, partial [Clostridia bacterium]|nr:GTPase Era [Clostridia bacterium]
MTKTAFIMIAGKPNVGKSTLLNTILGEKVAIVSRKPQTTRNRITGVLTKGENQYVFTDTPGLHKPKTLLGEYMMRSVGNVADNSDIILFVVEAGSELNPSEKSALDKYSASGLDVILVINKTDRANKIKLAEQIMALSTQYKFHSVIPVSALTGDGVDIILSELDPLLTESIHFFPEDYITDQPERKIFAELIREKVLRLLDDEIPHGVAVSVEDFSEKKGMISVRAEIYCERESHKRIIIGKNGS